jgi:hypothetical protein
MLIAGADPSGTSFASHVWRTAMSMSKPALDPPFKRKRYATKKEVAEALTEALRTYPDCDGIRVRKITAAEFEAAKAGQTLTAEQHHVMLEAKLDLQKQLDLSEDI